MYVWKLVRERAWTEKCHFNTLPLFYPSFRVCLAGFITPMYVGLIPARVRVHDIREEAARIRDAR